MSNCHGCAVQHPSSETTFVPYDGWRRCLDHDDVVEKIELSLVLKTAESVCSALSTKLGKSWEVYVTELPKVPWTNRYITGIRRIGPNTRAARLNSACLLRRTQWIEMERIRWDRQ